MIGDAVAASRFAQELNARGVYAVSFSFPVVPRDTARLRTQMSAAHTRDDLARAADVFVEAREAIAA
jgi:glycine C-acetyltransferase